MKTTDVHFTDEPPYDAEFVRVIAFACFFVLSPVFILLFLFDTSIGVWALLLWIIVPLLVYSIPYLLVVPTHILITPELLQIKHGLTWTIKIPVSSITDTKILEYPPMWANFQYFYPYAQWVRLSKTSGWLSWWYVPTTSATQLVLVLSKIKEQ